MQRYDHAEAAALVYAHLCRYPGLSPYEIQRALGWFRSTRSVTGTGTRRARTALAELEAAGRVRVERTRADTGPGFKDCWFPI